MGGRAYMLWRVKVLEDVKQTIDSLPEDEKGLAQYAWSMLSDVEMVEQAPIAYGYTGALIPTFLALIVGFGLTAGKFSELAGGFIALCIAVATFILFFKILKKYSARKYKRLYPGALDALKNLPAAEPASLTHLRRFGRIDPDKAIILIKHNILPLEDFPDIQKA